MGCGVESLNKPMIFWLKIEFCHRSIFQFDFPCHGWAGTENGAQEACNGHAVDEQAHTYLFTLSFALSNFFHLRNNFLIKILTNSLCHLINMNCNFSPENIPLPSTCF